MLWVDLWEHSAWRKPSFLSVAGYCNWERLPFVWNFRVGFLGQMEQYIYACSIRCYTRFVKNDPDELGRLGRVVPRFTKSSAVGERMARVRFLQMVQLIPVISVETKKEEYLRMYSFYSGKFSPGWTVPFDISSEKNGFSVQMVSAPGHVIFRFQEVLVQASLESWGRFFRGSLF